MEIWGHWTFPLCRSLQVSGYIAGTEKQRTHAQPLLGYSVTGHLTGGNMRRHTVWLWLVMPSTPGCELQWRSDPEFQGTPEGQQLRVEVKAALAGPPLCSLLATTQMGITMHGLLW